MGRVDRGLVKKRAELFLKELKPGMTVKEIEAASKISASLRGLPKRAVRAVLMGTYASLQKAGKVRVIAGRDMATSHEKFHIADPKPSFQEASRATKGLNAGTFSTPYKGVVDQSPIQELDKGFSSGPLTPEGQAMLSPLSSLGRPPKDEYPERAEEDVNRWLKFKTLDHQQRFKTEVEKFEADINKIVVDAGLQYLNDFERVAFAWVSGEKLSGSFDPLALAKLIASVYKISRHPVWCDQKQSSNTFEIETTLAARVISELQVVKADLVEVFKGVNALHTYADKKKLPGWDYYFSSGASYVEVSKGRFDTFLQLWLRSGFARLNVGHKLAAALALTDAPEIPLHSPWDAWSLTIPDGFFSNLKIEPVAKNGNPTKSEDATVSLRRAWFIGTEIVCLLGDWEGATRGTAITWNEHMDLCYGKDIVQMVKNLGMGAIAAIENHPVKQSSSWGSTRSKTNEKRLEAPAVGATYELAAPVTIDLRDDLKRIVAGERRGKGTSPKAYWIVKGHWKQQVHGPKRGLRKTIWIEPYPKGDPSLKVLMRTVDVDE